MVARCYRQSHPAWPWYGGRGIMVCERWRRSYQAFLADMGEAPPGLWLDRIDGSKGYEPGNCRWVTPSESAHNRRQRPQVPGSLRQLAQAAGIPYHVVYQRVRFGGWSAERALSTPKRPMGRQPGERQGIPRAERIPGSRWSFRVRLS